MKKFLLTLLLLMILPVNALAQDAEDDEDDEEEYSLQEALANIKVRELPLSLEARFNEQEIIFRYKNFSIDYNYVDSQKNLNYIKLNLNSEIISMFGSGVNWSCGVTGVTWDDSKSNFVPVPTLGVDLYITLRPRVRFYTQFSGMPVGGFGRIYDAESGFRYSPSKHFTIITGYRHLSAKVHHSYSHNNFTTSGPFIGIRSDF